MSQLDSITKQSWVEDVFPEWGSWLNEEIEAHMVPHGSVTMWWLGCTGVWIKTCEGNNLCIDLWCGSGKRTQRNEFADPHHQMMRMSGGRRLQPNLRISPFVLDVFEVRSLDAVLSTHFHNDHIDPYLAAAVLQNCASTVPFIGPRACVEKWISWGVPKNRCITVRAGDKLSVGSIQVTVLESFDRTALITSAQEELSEHPVADMDTLAVNYLVETSGGNIYHSGDSHYSNLYAKHGKQHRIDVALASYGENPVGITDKMTSSDVLRMAEALNTEVVIPIHYDIWSNFQADPEEILQLYRFRKHRMKYHFHPFVWQVGGRFTYPDDRESIQYQYPRGFDDCFEAPVNLPYPSFL